VTAPYPGCDEVVLTTPDSPRPCNSLACARAGRLAEVIMTCGVLNDPAASYHDRGALWRESWHRPIPLCAGCWDSCRQIALEYRPGLAVCDRTASATPRPPLERT
jgi:hypothetical protein